MRQEVEDRVDERLNQIERRMDTLAEHTETLVQSVNQLVQHMDKHTIPLLAIVQNRIPEGSISLATHKSIVVSLIWAFTSALAVILGAKELISYLHAA